MLLVALSRQEGEGLPLYLSPVEAGFLSPAEDFLDTRLDLHSHLVCNESATFFLRAHGESMINVDNHTVTNTAVVANDALHKEGATYAKAGAI